MRSFHPWHLLISALPCSPFIGVLSAQPRETAWTPEKTLASIRIDGAYDVRLAAAEPLVRDPVEMCWDADGACYVADMIDYPLGGPDGAPLSRVQRLIDTDGDGAFDRAVTFADKLDHVQGLLPHEGGLIATTRTQVLFLKDTDGDGVADVRRPLIAGFNPSFSQLQVASPRWGPDGEVYFNNGLDSKQIYPVAGDGSEGAKTDIARTNLRWNPETGALHAAAGFGQYGGGFDDWGRHYCSSNRSPVMFAVVPPETLAETTAPARPPWENIAPHGPASRVFPLQITHTTSDAHSGTNTSACGLGVYRGHLMPELAGEVFVCDPTGQLITRFRKPEAHGGSLTTSRTGNQTEFFRSSDEWCRPVNITTGPDGALYVCDIYRRFIDHARFFPDDFVKSHDMRTGENEGRIWKIMPKGFAAEKPTAAAKDTAGLITWLSHPNAWQRETAQRLLRERATTPETIRATLDALAESKPTTAPGKLHTLWLHATLSGRAGVEAAPLLALTESAPPELAENIVLIAHRHPAYFGKDMREIVSRAAVSGGTRARMLTLLTTRSTAEEMPATIKALLAATADLDDPWFQQAVMVHLTGHTGRFTGELLAGPFADKAADTRSAFIRDLSAMTAASKDKEDLAALLSPLGTAPGELRWWKAAMLEGLAQGLPKAGVKSLAEFASVPAPGEGDPRAEIPGLLEKAGKIIADASLPDELRIASMPLLSQQPYEAAAPVLKELVSGRQPAAISRAAFAIVRKHGAKKTAPLLYEILPTANPALRQEIIAMLGNDPGTLPDMLQRMDRGEVPKSLVDAESRWRFLQSKDATIKGLAEKLFERPADDRAAVITAYLPAADAKGDSVKGKELFTQLCSACHTYQGHGSSVGPDISDVRAKDKRALINDILDPNRMIEARWSAYLVKMKDGRMLSGIIDSDTPAAVVLKMPGGVSETISRADISSMESHDASLMPVGLEGGITVSQMADLLAFLRGEAPDK
ncbi:MAG: c-type cytochrome [Akkermansiaceae bacterium]|nr:c-type cytochrome [Akkermansiaceae bacterium]